MTARDRRMSDEDYQDELMAARAFSNYLRPISIYPDGTGPAGQTIAQILPGGPRGAVKAAGIGRP